MTDSRTRGQRAGLSRAAVLGAARVLLDERGADGVSMRAVAERLGVAPNALYSHVRSKTDLVDALLDDALGAVETPAPADPRTTLAQIMTGSYDALMARRDLVPLYLARRGARGPEAHRLGDVMHQALLDAGLDEPTARRARHALIVSAIGFAAYDSTSPEPAAARDAFLDALGWLLDGLTPRPR